MWKCTFYEITTQEPMKTCYNLLKDTSQKVPTIYIIGNHDYDVGKHISNMIIVRRRELDNILYVHGYQFDSGQWIGIPFYDLISDYFPWIYQRFFKTPFQVIGNQDGYGEQIRKMDEAVRKFAEKKNYKYIVYGHSHHPEISGKLLNCGDMVDSCSYILIEDGEPELKYI